MYFFFFDNMEEYRFINNLFEEVLFNLKGFIKRELINQIDIIELNLSNFENNRKLCLEKITELYDIFIRKVYCYGENIDNYELLNVNISDYHFDTQLGILQIRLYNYMESIEHKINKVEWFSYTYWSHISSYKDFLDKILLVLYEKIKKTRLIIISAYLLLSDFYNKTLMKDCCNNLEDTYLSLLWDNFELKSKLELLIMLI